MRKILIFAGIAVMLVGIPLLSKMTGGAKAKEVTTKPASIQSIRSSILASGVLMYREQVQLRSEVIGQVTELNVEESDRVEKGELLIILDPKTYQAQVDQADARVRIQTIAIERQRLLIENLEDRFERQKALFDTRLVDEDSFEALENQLSLARVDLRSLQESLSQARAALSQSEELLEKTRIRSPIDGIVIQLDVKVGETVIAGTTNIPGSTIMVIADPSDSLAEVQVDEADIAQITIGQPADIFTAAFPETALAGTVQSIAAVAKQSPGQRSLSFLVKVLLDEQGEMQIRPGMSVRADIYNEASEQALSVPIGSIRYDESGEDSNDQKEDQPFVFVMSDDKAVRRDIKTGVSSDSDQEVLEGLDEGEIVITGPFRILRHLNDGDLVKLKEQSEVSGVVIQADDD